MIQLSALTPTAAANAAPGAVQGQPGDGAEAADFGAILAGEIPPSVGETSAEAASILAPGLAAKHEKAALGLLPDVAALPEGGKILPSQLPDHVPPGLAKTVAAMPKASMRLQGGQASQHAAEAALSKMPHTSVVDAPTADDAGDEAAFVAPIPGIEPLPVLAVAPNLPGTAPTAAEPASTDPAPTGSQTALPLPVAQQQAGNGQPAPAAQHGQANAAMHHQHPMLQLDPVSAKEAAPAIAAIIHERPVAALALAMPTAEASVTARLKLNPGAAPVREAEAASGDSLAALFTAPTQAPVATPPNAASPVAAVQHTARPHDFAALVDSLVAAREAAQPHSVSIALATAEFGAVQVRFKQDDAGLSVTMASADPDFARAASIAMPPAPSASTDASSQQNASPQARQQGQQGTQGQNLPGNSSSQGGQGSAQHHQNDRAAARSNPSPRSAGNGNGAVRSDIFA